jgi:TolB-like protein
MMTSADGIESPQRPPSVFLSYASEDRPAARSIRDALLAFGIEVWYDENELDGGDAWDQKIRRQIRECDYFMPMVSATTEARAEGYFRREWRLAVERTLDMADDHPFLLPVVIDDTREAGARVPEKFVAVQWLKAPGGRPTPALEALCRRIVSGKRPGPRPPERAPEQPSSPAPKAKSTSREAAPGTFPEFPREEPGQRLHFLFQVIGWGIQYAWSLFMRLPKWVRVVAYIWLFILVLGRTGEWLTPHGHRQSHDADLSPANAQKLNAIANQYQVITKPADIARLGQQIAREFHDEAEENSDEAPVLAIPFSAPGADPAAEKLANSTFVQVYGRIAIAHQGKVALSKEPLPNLDSGTALARGKASHATYVLSGAIDTQASAQVLTVKIVTVADGSVLWSKSYPVTGADSATIAADVDSEVASLDD